MPSTPLPPLVPRRVQENAYVRSAYDIVLRLEKTVLADIASAPTASARQAAELQLIYCRIVGHFFHHVPSDMGLKNIVQEVSSCQMDDQKLLDIGRLYYDHAFRVFRSAQGRTPAQSHHPSRPSFNSLADMIKAKLEEAPPGHRTAKNRALVRDGFRCVISGKYDFSSAEKSEELGRAAQGNLATTQCAHIFSESTNFGLNEGSTKADYAASAWAVLSRFGGHDIQKELNGPSIHRLENVMTLDPSVHFLFDSLKLWLEPTNVQNQYKVKGRYPHLLVQYPKVVTFTTPDPAQLPLPSREYLELHAACAKVAHLSGAAEYFEGVDRDMDETFVLAKDGSSAAVLEHAIWAALRHWPVSA